MGPMARTFSPLTTEGNHDPHDDQSQDVFREAPDEGGGSVAGQHPISMTGVVAGTSSAILTPHVAAAATSQGFRVAAPVPGTLMLSRSSRPVWAAWTGVAIIALAVAIGATGAGPGVWLIVLIGIACIVFVRTSETVSLVVIDGAAGATVTASGMAGDDLEQFVGGLFPDEPSS